MKLYKTDHFSSDYLEKVGEFSHFIRLFWKL